MPEDLAEIKVTEVMTKNVVTVSTDTTIQKAAQLMQKRDIRGVIVTKNGKVVGILTDKDIIGTVIAKNKPLSETTVGQIMTPEIVIAHPGETLSEVSRKMALNKIGRIPIIDKQENLVGIVTETDMTRVYPGLLDIFYERSKDDFTSIRPERTSLEGRCEECGNFSQDLVETDGKWICSECAEK